MKHLIICREYPPAPGGGIGTYALHISRLLARSGETVHVIGQLWEGAEREVEEQCCGRLIVHRIPFQDWTSFLGPKPDPAIKSEEAKGLFESSFPPQCFSWQAGLLAEHLIEQEGIDIIEGQEYEAPLYYLLLRRALGLGPTRCPPCLVHLHSPTEFIVRYNEWEIGHPYSLTAKRLEDYTIGAADALLCPSRSLARQVEALHEMAEGAIQVVPYPIGDGAMLERDEGVWEHGTICYVGRLERRKGVIEWIDAAVVVAREYPTAHFEFVGANVLHTNRMTGAEFVNRRIPKDLRGRFHFSAEQRRSVLPKFLARARMAVIPSRWDNFPNACIEAMCSGLPVIASREGGMTEMIEDGRTGWLASEAGSEGLAEALRRALVTPPMKIAEMGRHASSDIREMCANEKIVERQLDLRSQIVHQGSKRSSHLPTTLPWATKPHSRDSARRTQANNSQSGIAIVITCLNPGQFLDECFQGVEQQTQKPTAVVVVDDGSSGERTLEALDMARRKGWQIVQEKYGALASARNAGIEAILSSGSNPLGVVFLGPGDRLLPGFVATCESILQRCPDVGLVSCWARTSEAKYPLWIHPCPCFPFQWVSNDAASYSAVRMEALCEAGFFPPTMNHGYDGWDLSTAVMAVGWVAVTAPAILVERQFWEDSVPQITSAHDPGSVRKEFLERFPYLIAHDAKEIALLLHSVTAQALGKRNSRWRKQIAMMRTTVRHPLRTASQVFGKARKKMHRRRSVGMPNCFPFDHLS